MLSVLVSTPEKPLTPPNVQFVNTVEPGAFFCHCLLKPLPMVLMLILALLLEHIEILACG
jgi:hypothetical protein